MSTPVNQAYQRFEFTLDGGIAERAAIGLIVLATDATIEHEWRQMTNLPGVALYESRLYNAPQINEATLADMEKDIAPATALIRPGSVLDVVAFGCTSGAMVIGEDVVARRIHEVRPGVAWTTPITAAINGIKALEASRIALLTPYVKSVNDWMAQYLQARDIQVVRMGSFEHDNDNEVSRIDANSLAKATRALAVDPSVDAVFVSCTSLRLIDQIQQLEAEIKKPVLSSNHAMAWHALRLAKVSDSLPQFGHLFEV